jgi:membrane protease YdiL (CAAX protease family)
MTALQLSVYDHLLVVLLAMALPVGGFLSLRKIRRQVAAGIAHTTRVADYRNNMIIMWAVTFLAATLWIALGRDWAALGFAPVTGSGLAVGIAFLLAGSLVAFNVYYSRQVEQSDTAAKDLVAMTEGFDMVLPHTHRELKWFYGLSVTAGITEEVLYRGFLMAYLGGLLPLPAVIVVSSLIFALAHLYQGLTGASRTFLVGLALATTYALTGSILFCVIAHVLVDIIGGRMIFSAFNRYPPAAAAQETC